MNVVLISDCGPFDVYLIEHVRERWAGATVLRVGPPSGGLTPARRKALLRSPLRTGFRYAEQLLFYRRYRRRLAREISQQLFGSPVPPPLENAVDVPIAELNSPATRQLLEKLAPDVLVVSSAPLLKPDIYSTPRFAAINVHRGISPAYRGESTLFWALYHGDYDHVGVTIHHLDPGIDSGRVLAQGFLPLGQRNSEASLLASAARISAELVVDFLSEAGSCPGGQALPGPSRLFRSRDRRIWHDARRWLGRVLLGNRIGKRPARKVEYFGSNSN